MYTIIRQHDNEKKSTTRYYQNKTCKKQWTKHLQREKKKTKKNGSNRIISLPIFHWQQWGGKNAHAHKNRFANNNNLYNCNLTPLYHNVELNDSSTVTIWLSHSINQSGSKWRHPHLYRSSLFWSLRRHLFRHRRHYHCRKRLNHEKFVSVLILFVFFSSSIYRNLIDLFVGQPQLTDWIEISFILAQILKLCHRNDPNLPECIRNAIESIRANLTDGIPELLVPPCEPLKIPEIHIKQNAGAIRVESEYSDIVIAGFSNFTMRDIAVDVPNKQMQVDLWFPTLDMTANYLIHGKLLLMPITGNGTAYGRFCKRFRMPTKSSPRDQWENVWFLFSSFSRRRRNGGHTEEGQRNKWTRRQIVRY